MQYLQEKLYYKKEQNSLLLAFPYSMDVGFKGFLSKKRERDTRLLHF